MHKKIPYWKTTGWLNWWELNEGTKGCVPVAGAELCMDKRPPPLPAQVAAEAKAAALAAPLAPTRSEVWIKRLDSAEKFLYPEAYAKKHPPPPAAAPPAPAPPPPIAKLVVPPFDLYDMPQAMRAAGFKIAAKFNQRWLDGRYYLAPLVFNASGKQISEGYYPPDMVDTDTIAFDWLFTYKEPEKKYNELLSSLKTNNTIAVLKGEKPGEGQFTQFLKDNPTFNGDLKTLDYCKGDLQRLHKSFQFQRAIVAAWAGFDMREIKSDGMTDLMASLASFSLYAAVAHAKIRRDPFNQYPPDGIQRIIKCMRTTVEITHVYIYAKDNYSFFDEGHRASQYLGHWNKTGVILAPGALSAELAGQATNHLIDIVGENDPWTPPPIDIGYKRSGSDVFYPIRNITYRDWRIKFRRGGDFLIFSNQKKIRLEVPIKFEMEEVCEPNAPKKS